MHPCCIRHSAQPVALILLFLVAGCSRKPDPGRQVKNGVEFAKRNFELINRNPVAAASFGSISEMGGTPLSYLTACIQDPAGLPAFTSDQPAAPYTVAISYDNQQNCFVIEGYTDNITKPAMVEKVEYRGAWPQAGSQKPTGTAPLPESPQQPADKAELNAALFEASSSGETGTVKSLISQGAEVNARSNEGGTPLMYACAKGHAAVAQMLIAAGADPKARADDQNAWPVIMYAAHFGSPDIMAMLLEKDLDPNVCDQFKNTPLMLASLRGHAKAAEMLIRAGANLNAQETKQNNFPLLYAVSRGNPAVAAVLIQSGANVNLCDKSGMTALMSCAEKGNTEIAVNLIKAKADIEAKLTGKVGTGATALMLAAVKGQAEMVRLLLNSGANVKATDNNGSTAYDLAIHNGHPDIAEIIQTAERGVIPKAPQVAAQGVQIAPHSAASSASNPQSLVGKEQPAADAMFGRPVGTIKQGETTIIMYRNAEIIVQQNIITQVKGSAAPARNAATAPTGTAGHQ